MTDTGWKHPQTVGQDNRRSINNGLSCYAFKNLDNIKKNDNSFTDIRPWPTTGIDLEHKSPFIYAYNYNFNLPKNALVTKITLFVLVQQLTHTKPYYDPQGKLRHSISKFWSVKLKQGVSLLDGGTGNNMASKCGSQMLPYKKWSTEDLTTFTGTPSDWGITSKDIVSIINSNNFGCVIQFAGTVHNGWTTPAVAKMQMKIDYDIIQPVEEPKSEFTDFKISYHNNTTGKDSVVTFDKDNRSGIICTLNMENRETVDDYAILKFTYYHKGGAGETPYVYVSSPSLFVSHDAKQKDKVEGMNTTFIANKLKCSKDTTVKTYTQSIAVFPGIMMGRQTLYVKYNDTVYTLYFNVSDDGSWTDEDRNRFLNFENSCRINNCLFYSNIALWNGGANYVTSEFYKGTNNIYGTTLKTSTTESTVNTAVNKKGESVTAHNLWHNGKAKSE